MLNNVALPSFSQIICNFASVKRCIFVLLCLMHVLGIASQEVNENVVSYQDEDSKPAVKLWRPVAWLMDYLLKANRESNKPFDCTVVFGPSYSSTMNFSISGGMSGSYSWDRKDPELPRSHVTLFLSAGISGMMKVGIEGNNYMPRDRQRWDYELKLEYLPTDFWGLGYLNGVNNANKGRYHQLKFSFRPNYLFRVAPSLYVGPQLFLQYAHTYMFSDISMIQGQLRDIGSYGGGAVIRYDSRDFALNAYKGQFLQVQQTCFPRFANKSYFNSTEVTLDSYHRVWKGGILAFDIHAQFQYGNVPWTMYSLVGRSGRMRGYYEGRYRDRDIVEAQMELRQHVYKRFGAVAWVGGANVFHDIHEMYWSRTLPNYGVGIRWEFKHRINMRLDFGLTKNKPGFEFKLNEAF